MKLIMSPNYSSIRVSTFLISIGILFAFTFIVPSEITYASGIELYSKDASPFGFSLDYWTGKWWNWWVGTTIDEATPKDGGCLMNKSESMVMLMETTVGGKQTQVCEISSSQGIIVPLWVAWMEASQPPYSEYTYEQLSKAAREEANLGGVTSLVKVDGKTISKLNEVSSMKSGKLDYKINTMQNVTELYSKGFNITIPESTHYPDQIFGTWPAGTHGYWLFLKPLPPGSHELYYNVGVTGTGPNDVSSEITYSLKVQ